MPQQGKSRDTRLKILGCREVFAGRNQAGHAYTIYEVEAAKEDGSPVDEKLRSFAPLPIGRTIDVTVTAYRSAQHGRSFTLHRKVTPGSSSAEQIEELREQFVALAERVAKLEEQLVARRDPDAAIEW